MHIEFLVEEQSAEAALVNLIPKIVGNEASFKIISFQGKPDLLAKLPERLRGYRQWLPESWRIVVLVDVDNEDCRVLKGELERMASDAGLTTKTAAGGERFQVLNRLAIEELEAWFIGDEEALRAAYPRVVRNLAQKEKYRDPDAIAGGTWEALERLLQKGGYFKGGLGKGYRSTRNFAAHGAGKEPVEELPGLQGRTSSDDAVSPAISWVVHRKRICSVEASNITGSFLPLPRR